jgi:hypothetical protein
MTKTTDIPDYMITQLRVMLESWDNLVRYQASQKAKVHQWDLVYNYAKRVGEVYDVNAYTVIDLARDRA